MKIIEIRHQNEKKKEIILSKFEALVKNKLYVSIFDLKFSVIINKKQLMVSPLIPYLPT